MKKVFVYLIAIIGFVLLAAVAIPFLYKDKIKARINAEIEKNINAKVYYGDLDLSIFRNFPQITIGLQNFGLHGNAPFEGDTLLDLRRFDASFNISALWKKETISVKKLALIDPKIHLLVLKDGITNYDILPHNSSSNTENRQFDLMAQLNSWLIENGDIVYENRKEDLIVKLDNINHTGAGSIVNNNLNLTANTTVDKAMANYKSNSYLNNRTISFEGPMAIDWQKGLYKLQNGKLKINDLPVDLTGEIQKPDSNIYLDVKFASAKNEDFKKLISLIPSLYTADYANVKSEGNFTVSGSVKGKYNAVSLPSFDITANVNNGKIQYPGLQLPLEAVNIDAHILNTKDQLKYTEINLPKFSLKLGKNPIAGYLRTKGLINTAVDGALKGDIDLADFQKLFPMPSLQMRGKLLANIKANGWYDAQHFPKVNGVLKLNNGYLKSQQFAEPIENINVNASINNSTGQATDTKINIENAGLVMQNEPFQLKGTVENLSNASWDLIVKGKLDFGKITAVFPLDGMKLEGKIDADFSTKGNMTAIKTNNYAALNATGKAVLNNFVFKDETISHTLTATSAELAFTPKNIIIQKANGTLGHSDYTGTGTIENYFGYLFNNQNLVGNLNITSNNFNINEWMTDENTNATTLTAENIKAIEIPKNIDLNITAKIGQSAYETMKLNNADGFIKIKDGIVSLSKVNFNALGGRFVTNGAYNSQDITHPKFDFDLDLQQIGIPDAYQHLWVVRTLMPIAEYMLGQVTSKVKIGGELGQDMVPKIMSLSGQGLIKLIKAQLKENGVIKEVAEKAQLPVLKSMVLKDLLMQAEVKDGRMGFKPFAFAVNDHKFTLGGYNALDGTLDWNIAVDAPTGDVGKGFDVLFKTWTGKKLPGTDRVAFDLKMGGTYKQPKLVFVASKTANNIKDAVTAEAKAQIEAAKAKAQAELDKLKNEAEAKKKELEDKAKAELDKLKAEAEAKKKELEAQARAEAERIKKEAEDKVKAELERVKKEAEDKARTEADRIKKIAEEKLAEEKARIEKIVKAKLDSTQKANADKIKKALEDRAKAAAEQKRKEAEAKAKAAEEKAKAEIEAKKKAAEEELKKVVKPDSTGN